MAALLKLYGVSSRSGHMFLQRQHALPYSNATRPHLLFHPKKSCARRYITDKIGALDTGGTTTSGNSGGPSGGDGGTGWRQLPISPNAIFGALVGVLITVGGAGFTLLYNRISAVDSKLSKDIADLNEKVQKSTTEIKVGLGVVETKLDIIVDRFTKT